MEKQTKRKETERTGSTPTNKDPRTDQSTSESGSTSTINPLSYAEVLADTDKRLEDATIQSIVSQRSTYDRKCQVPGKSTGQLRDQMKDWLKCFGTVLTEPEEVTEKLFNEEGGFADEWKDEGDNDDDVSVLGEDLRLELPDIGGTGTYKAKVRIISKPPQYLPIYGQKVRVHYQGIEKTCTHCYYQGHIKRECTNAKTQWIDYVKYFMDIHPGIPNEYYGRWVNVIKNEFPQEAGEDEQQQKPTSPEKTN